MFGDGMKFDVTVRKDLATTGVRGLDSLLGGGIPYGTSLLLLAEPGGGSETFAEQFIMGGLQSGEEISYFSTERPIEEIKKEMLRFGWDTAPFEEAGKIKFIDAYTPRFIHIMPKSLIKKQDAKEYLRSGADALSLLKSVMVDECTTEYRGVIDSLSFFLTKYNLEDVTKVMESVMSMCKVTRGTRLFLMTRGMHDSLIENTMKHMADGVIEFIIRERGSELERQVVIRKMRGMFIPNKTFIYHITPRGIELETTTRVL
ncbi:MAG: ATPase domain-containing protein [Methanocellales archaeon]